MTAWLAILVAFVVSGFSGSVLAQGLTVSIDKIVTNDRIFGTVRSASGADLSSLKVVVYVETDRWYVHPWARQGEGKSWTRINQDGTWEIKTVKREFSAARVAAVVTRVDYREPNILEDINAIPHLGIRVKDLEGTPDYGKL